MFPRGIFLVFSLLSSAALAAGQSGWGQGQSLVSGGGDRGDTSWDKGCQGRVRSCVLQDVLSCRAGRACSGQAGRADSMMHMCLCCRNSPLCQPRPLQLSSCGKEQSSGVGLCRAGAVLLPLN